MPQECASHVSHFDNDTLAELANSIAANGVIQPILVRSVGDDSFEIVAGERRWRAAQIAGLKTIPAIIRELSDSQSFEVALIENLQREDLDPLERAAAYKHYMDAYGGSIEGLAQRLSESRANVSNYLRLLGLRPEIANLLSGRPLGDEPNQGHSRHQRPETPASSRPNGRPAEPRRSVKSKSWPARQTSPALGREKSTRPKDRRGSSTSPTWRNRSHRPWGCGFAYMPAGEKNSGRIVISYANLDEFDRVAGQLGASAMVE